MRDDWGSPGIPDADPNLPLLARVKSLIEMDMAMVQGLRMRDFSARQAALGFRQPVKISRPPELDVGALMDLGS
jgi:hypothetical protein